MKYYIIDKSSWFYRLVLDKILFIDFIFKKGIIKHYLHLNSLQTYTISLVYVLNHLLLNYRQLVLFNIVFKIKLLCLIIYSCLCDKSGHCLSQRFSIFSQFVYNMLYNIWKVLLHLKTVLIIYYFKFYN